MNEAIDVILEGLRGTGVDVRGTVQPNHVPMAAEALCALGHPDEAVAWARRARERLEPLPPRVGALTARELTQALGRPERIADWLDLFRRELEARGPFPTLASWVPRLTPGLLAGGGHALIRTGHAVRSLEQGSTAPRRDELAMSLAYWASAWRPLPGAPRLDGRLSLDEAARALPRIGTPQTRRGPPRLFVQQVDAAPGFASAVESAGGPTDPIAALHALASLGARLYLDHAAEHPLVFLHTVTLPAALGLVLPHLSGADRLRCVAHAWQASAAWISAYDDRQPPAPPPEHAVPSPAQLVERAVESGDAHVVKLTEACLRLHAQTGERAYLEVAADFAGRVAAARSWTDAQRARAGLRFD